MKKQQCKVGSLHDNDTTSWDNLLKAALVDHSVLWLSASPTRRYHCHCNNCSVSNTAAYHTFHQLSFQSSSPLTQRTSQSKTSLNFYSATRTFNLTKTGCNFFVDILFVHAGNKIWVHLYLAVYMQNLPRDTKHTATLKIKCNLTRFTVTFTISIRFWVEQSISTLMFHNLSFNGNATERKQRSCFQ